MQRSQTRDLALPRPGTEARVLDTPLSDVESLSSGLKGLRGYVVLRSQCLYALTRG